MCIVSCEISMHTAVGKNNKRILFIIVYIFRNKDNQLIKSTNGKVKKGKWDYLPSMKALLIELEDETTLYNQGFF